MMRFVTHTASRLNPLMQGALALLLASTCLSAVAQMQIPNPLIRPRSLAAQAAAQQANAAGAQGSNGSPSTAASTQPKQATSQSYAGAIPLPGTVLPTEDPFERNLAELTARFSQFYVSAVVGKQAVLRRASDSGTATGGTSSPSGSTSQAFGTSPQSASSIPVANKRNESMTLRDGQVLDTVNKAGAMMVKVLDGQVVITYIQESMSLPGGKLIGRSAIAFTGGIESSGGGAITPIVLERVDPAYKKMISVETKSRTTGNSSSQDSSTSNSSSNLPQIQLSPAP